MLSKFVGPVLYKIPDLPKNGANIICEQYFATKFRFLREIFIFNESKVFFRFFYQKVFAYQKSIFDQ